MIVVAGGDHAESEDDAGGSPDVETELPSEEICEGAEDEGSQDEADHGECVEVSHHHGLQCQLIFSSHFTNKSQQCSVLQH